MQETKGGNKSIYFITAITIVVLLLSANSGNLYLALLAIALLPIGLFKPAALIPMYFISSLSSEYFEVIKGVGFTRLVAFTILGGTLIRLFASRKPINTIWIANSIFIALATLISFLLGYDNNNSPLFIVGLNLLIFIAMTNLSLDKDELIQLFRAIFLAVILTTIYYSISFYTNPYLHQNGRLTISGDVNENSFGMMMAQLSAYSLAYMIIAKRMFVKYVCFIAGLLNAYFVLLSGSRSALLGLIMGFALALLISMYLQKKLKKWTFGMIVIGITLIAAFYFIIESNPMLAYRLNIENLISSQGAGRWPRIVEEVQNIIPSHPLFGVGPSAVNEMIVLNQYLNNPGSSHNIIISALAQVGFIGFFAYMVVYWKIIKRTVSRLHMHEELIIPLILIYTATFNGIGEVIYDSRLFWNTLSLAALSLGTFTNEYLRVNMFFDKHGTNYLKVKHNNEQI